MGGTRKGLRLRGRFARKEGKSSCTPTCKGRRRKGTKDDGEHLRTNEGWDRRLWQEKMRIESKGDGIGRTKDRKKNVCGLEVDLKT